jgi:hypothetical protein
MAARFVQFRYGRFGSRPEWTAVGMVQALRIASGDLSLLRLALGLLLWQLAYIVCRPGHFRFERDNT